MKSMKKIADESTPRAVNEGKRLWKAYAVLLGLLCMTDYRFPAAEVIDLATDFIREHVRILPTSTLYLLLTDA